MISSARLFLFGPRSYKLPLTVSFRMFNLPCLYKLDKNFCTDLSRCESNCHEPQNYPLPMLVRRLTTTSITNGQSDILTPNFIAISMPRYHERAFFSQSSYNKRNTTSYIQVTHHNKTSPTSNSSRIPATRSCQKAGEPDILSLS